MLLAYGNCDVLSNEVLTKLVELLTLRFVGDATNATLQEQMNVRIKERFLLSFFSSSKLRETYSKAACVHLCGRTLDLRQMHFEH